MYTANIELVKRYFLELQDKLCNALEQVDGSACFQEERWERPDGGWGRSKVLSNGAIFEQAGVNFSHVFGAKMPAAATNRHPELANSHFQALGVSLVLH